jgi:phosphate transport system substrate-binding protein
MLSELIEAATNLFEVSDRLKQMETSKRKRIADYFLKISDCLHESAEQLKNGAVPHKKWGELQVYAKDLRTAIGREIGKERTDELSRLLETTVSATPTNGEDISLIEIASGKFKGLAFTITAGQERLVSPIFVGLVMLATVSLGIWLWPRAPNTSEPPGKKAVAKLIDVQNVPSGSFNYGGSTTWAPIRDKNRPIAAAIQKAFPNFQLKYLESENLVPSSAEGMNMLVKGELTFAQTSRRIIEQSQQSSQQTVKFKSVHVATSFKAVAVHPSLNIPNGLKVDEIDGICKGAITNWQDVGGPDLDIVVFTRHMPKSDTSKQEPTIGDQCSTSNMVTVPIPQMLIQRLADTQGGVYISAAPIIVPQCAVKTLQVKNSSGQLISPYKEPFSSGSECMSRPNQVNIEAFKNGSYPQELGDSLYVVIKQNGQIEQQVGEAYANLLLSGEGQQELEKTGYVGIRR